ncbi:MAG: methyltransferase, partial [Myxococcales bacterium]|nr:methyltransferase [Myxococcales bacterium]
PLGPLYEVRSATEVALVFPLPSGDDLSERIAAGLTHPLLQAALEAWTDGAPRFRLAFSAGGHHRSVRWAVAQRLAQRGSPLLNDSREVCWTVEVDEAGDRLLCLPRGADPRFAYRRRDVPAATHPTLAALLAWTGAPRPGEVVWDPFCGSGSELVEAARLRDGLHLRGTDVSPRALDAARLNLAAAALDAASTELRQASALEVAPHHQGRPVSLILSNPPMGRRAQVEDRRARQLLVDFVGHAARVLGPQGRMVWLSPAPRATARAGVAHGLHVEDLDAIDMGGFWATPQILRQSS